MDEEDKKLTEQEIFEKTYSAGEAWLRNYGVDSAIIHNNIIAYLAGPPQVVHVEYDMGELKDGTKVLIADLYMDFWRGLFTKKQRVIDILVSLLRQYLPDYQITINIKRWRSGMPRFEGR